MTTIDLNNTATLNYGAMIFTDPYNRLDAVLLYAAEMGERDVRVVLPHHNDMDMLPRATHVHAWNPTDGRDQRDYLCDLVSVDGNVAVYRIEKEEA